MVDDGLGEESRETTRLIHTHALCTYLLIL